MTKTKPPLLSHYSSTKWGKGRGAHSCGKKQIEMWFIVVCILADNEYVSILVSQTYFLDCFCILSEFVKVFERKV